MNIPGSIDAELKAAREEGRREGLREVIVMLKERAEYAREEEAMCASDPDCDCELSTWFGTRAGAYDAIKAELEKKVGND